MATNSNRSDFRRIFLILGASVIGLFALFVALGLFYFRSEIRHQILQRDGIHLTSVANFLNNRLDAENLQRELQLLHVAIETSGIEGIIAVRVFDSSGQFIRGVPETLFPEIISAGDKENLVAGHPVIRYFSHYSLYSLFNDFDSEVSDSVPLVEVISPVTASGNAPTGFIQFWLDGSAIAGEFKHLDHKLIITGLLLVSGGGIIFLILFTYARRRLLGMASLLAERNRSLEKANADLAMAARTSAIGSVASHLFHGLKNPLAGLKAYLNVTGKDEEAMAITDRMQSLINESLSVIRDQDSSNDETLSMDEIREAVLARFDEFITNNRPELLIRISGDGYLQTRKVQLLLLVIRNLVENAIEATPEDGTIHIVMGEVDGSFFVEIADTGPGLPESIKSRLFESVQSTKSGGTGIGLAISSVIARHIPATLELKRSSPEGTVFRINFSN